MWEKVDSSRASTSIGVFIESEFKHGPAALKKLKDNVCDRKLSKKLAEYLTSLIGDAEPVYSQGELANWLESQFAPVIERIAKAMVFETEVAKEAKASVGSFGMQAALLKKAYDATKDDPEAGEDDHNED